MNHALRILLALTLVLSGCATSPDQPPQSQTDNSAIKHWQLAGKIGLRGPDYAESAYLNWQQCDQQFAIQLSGPLGTGAVQLTGTPFETRISHKDEVLVTRHPEQLLLERLGWQLPVTDLPYWVRGLPAPDTTTNMHENGFQQNGWLVSISRYQSVDGYTLPSKLIAESPQLKVTLIIKEWQLEPSCPP